MKENNRRWKAQERSRKSELEGMKDIELHELANRFRPTPMTFDQYRRSDAIEFILATEGLLGREVE